jgi:hypothetical protein
MADGDLIARETIATAPAASGQTRANWFSDLKFHWDASLTVRKTGVRITLKELTAGELRKFFGYLGLLLVQAVGVRLSGRQRYKVWFTPDRPRPWYVVWSAATLAGVKFVHGPETADAVFYFEDVTVGAPPRIAGHRLLNAGVTDISKSRVAEAFGRIAGYDLKLDPTTHRGQAVEKNELNGKHDGRLVDCPTAPLPGKSYQRFIDSSDGATAFDYRTTIINRKPQFVLVKTKPAGDRFSIHNATVTFHELDKVFSAVEIDLIRRFAEEMQLDWGAFDVLRDRTSGRIYVVDVNKTDTGPAVDLSLKDRGKLKRAIAGAFREMIAEQAASPNRPPRG